MIILEDTRQQISKHKMKHEWFAEHGIQIERCRLYVGDYTLPHNQSICIDTKKDLHELVQDVTQQHERFRNELIRANEAGIKLIILCEHSSEIRCLEDVYFWVNPRSKKNPKATSGMRLFRILNTIKSKYNVDFEFCDKFHTGQRIVEILSREEVNI